MKDLLKDLLLFVLFCAAAACCAASDTVTDWRRRRAALDPLALLAALRQVESGDRPYAVGAAGERTAYQFTPATWARYTQRSLERGAADTSFANMVAAMHLAYLRQRLSARGLRETPENLARAWRHGPNFSPGATARSDYAARVANLYFDEIERRAKA